MGAVSSVVDTVSDVVSSVEDVVSGAVDTVKDVGSKVDDFVNKEIPGGWGTVAAVAVPALAPELATESVIADDGLTQSILDSGAVPPSGATSLPVPSPTDITSTALPPAPVADVMGTPQGLASYEGAFPSATTGTVASDVGASTLSPGLNAAVAETPVLESVGQGLQIGGGTTGLQLPTLPGLEEMGGAQGLSTTAAGGGALGAEGAGLAAGGLMAPVNEVTGLPLGQELSTVGTGIESLTGTPVTTPTGSNTLQNLFQRFLGNQIMADLFSPQSVGGLLTGAGGLVASQQDIAARQQLADQLRNAGLQASASAQFRPVGITTRFGTSQFQVNPQTGQLESAGYTVSPEIQALQNRLMGLTGTGLNISEQAAQEFAPLTGAAQRLFNLGGQYLAQSPEEAAQQYMTSRQALLQPERERQLATIRNRLQKTGRTGLSVAQGGELAASNPEMQAYYNALAQQDAQLAAQAEQAARDRITYGTGLFGNAANALGLRYSGLTSALQPFTQYLSGVSGLESQAQQPLGLSSNLGQLSSGAGYRSGYLGLQGNLGAAQAMYPATSYSALGNILGGLGSSPLASGLIGQGLGGLLSSGIGLLGSGAQASLANTALGGSGFGTGLAYGNQDIGLFI